MYILRINNNTRKVLSIHIDNYDWVIPPTELRDDFSKKKQIVRSVWRNSTENEGFGSEGKVDLRNVEKIWKIYHDE